MLFEYASGDVVSRNLALSVLRQLGFRGRAVAELLGLTENYVAALHNAALRDGPAALIKQDRRGTPGKVTGQQREKARELRAGGVPATRRSGGGWASRTPPSAAASARAGRATDQPVRAGRRPGPCSPARRPGRRPEQDLRLSSCPVL
jgi:hypothetical protein